MKFNKNIILFVLAMLFILAGFTAQYINDLKYILISNVTQNADAAEDIRTMLSQIDEVTSKETRYHGFMMDLNSYAQRLENIRLVQKTETGIIARTDEDSLVELQIRSFSDEDLEIITDKVAQLQDAAQKNDAEFLYIVAPRKTHAMDVPENAVDYRKENLATFMEKLDEKNINTLDLCEILRAENRLNESLYFKTDHHWKTEVGFWASGVICDELNARYGFDYDPAFTDLSNYDVTVYEDLFLGSYGKKVGQYFVPGGLDDFTLISPTFETDFTVTDSNSTQILNGDFSQTLLLMDKLNVTDYYRSNVYGVYRIDIGRQQAIKNNLNTEGKKILIIEDSYGCVVTPFLALNASEIHTIDTRRLIKEDNINIYDYMEQYDPDYVLVLYAGIEDVPDGYGRYDFG